MPRPQRVPHRSVPTFIDNADYVTFPPHGSCIYCGTTEGRLSKEHIVPYALNGGWVLPEASCKPCAKKTQKIEEICTSERYGVLYGLRVALGLRSRTKKGPRETIATEVVTREGKHEVRQFYIEAFPVMAWKMHLPPAGIILGAEPTNEVKAKVSCWVTNPNNTFVPKETTKGGSVNVEAFILMIAKIGYAYAAARVGAHSLLPMVREIILGKSDKAPYLIGDGLLFKKGGGPVTFGDDCTEPYLHRLAMHQLTVSDRTFTVSSVHLFADRGFPVYHVVVGERAANACGGAIE